MTIGKMADHEPTSAEEAGALLVDPAAYADRRLLDACRLLRQASPVHLVDQTGFEPFYAIVKHHDIQEVERQSDLFHAAPRYKLFREGDRAEGGRSLVSMDPPEHSKYRGLVSDWFHPRNLRKLEDRVRNLARNAVDAMVERNEPFDFVTEVAMHFPLGVICSMLGIPMSDRALILRLTQQNFGSEDPEYRASVATDEGGEAVMDFAQYFLQVAAERKEHPTDDLSSVLAHATIDDQPLPVRDLLGMFGILATAGHDTTSSAIAGGLLALLEHPDQLERLRNEPALVTSAVEEMIRWVSPVKSFMRTATRDVVIRGRAVGTGDAVLLLYASANRDEDVFDRADCFEVQRTPNRHIAFGHGIHFCLGAQLARLEMRAFFGELVPRLSDMELAGQPEQMKTLFVGGLKHLPVRLTVH